MEVIRVDVCQRASRPGRNTHIRCGGEGRVEWVLWLACDCPPGAVQYCTACKDAMLGTESAVICPECGTTYVPARKAYWAVDPVGLGVTP